MVKVLLNGCNGKMGQETIAAIKKTPDIEIIAGFDRMDTGDNNFPVFTDISSISVTPDVIIDFSIPVATMNILEYAKSSSTPIVIATTGFNEEQEEKIKEYSKIIPIFKSSNMSYDVMLLCHLVADVAKKLPNTDIEIVETHHNRKVDAPSGTAMMLASSINEALEGQMHYEFDRHSKREKRDKKEIGISSIRGGNECGTHSVIYFGENEKLEITHTANSRAVFSEGAAKAAFFIIHKNPGLYNMNDLL